MLRQILQKITKERIEEEVKLIRETKFPPRIEFWMNKYRLIGERDDFVFRWCYKINKEWILVPISSKYRKDLSVVKTLFNMFIVLVDDISEKRDKQKFLKELIKIPFDSRSIRITSFTRSELRYFNLVSAIWRRIEEMIKTFPRYKLVYPIYKFDVLQLINAFLYGYFITQSPYRMNENEYFSYFPSSMQIMINADLDMMCNKTFNMKEIGKLREAVLTAQKMARIGNWLTTWGREIRQNDFTSIVIPYGINKKIITWKDVFAENKDNLAEKIKHSDSERYYLQKWEEYFRELEKHTAKLHSVSSRRIVARFEYLIFMHLISKGLK